jgi:hypothetical protein
MKPLFALLLVACGAAVPAVSSQSTESAQVPATGVYSGTYSVPVSSELAASAIYEVDEITWSLSAGTATLSYKLPVELLGKSQHVSFSGPFGTSGTLYGEAGSAVCTTADRTITCREDMHALMPIEHDLERVAELAPTSLSSERVSVTRVFISDPIGIASFAF